MPVNSDNDKEYRPFYRRVPEFKFWYESSKGIIFSYFLTFFEIFNIPAYWPILLVYFITLFTVTMKDRISHMIKYKYVPWSVSKKKYNDGAIKQTAPTSVKTSHAD